MEKVKIPGAPHVYGGSVPPQLQEELWRTVPSCHDEGCVIADCVAIASARLGYRAVVVTGKTKIGDLE